MLRIGLTGGIGVGKTVVSEKFRVLYDVFVIDADNITRQLMQTGEDAYNEIVAIFGAKTLSDNKEINRKFLREVIFSDPLKRDTLEKILHPKVRNEIIKQTQLQSGPYCLIVIPLLIESNMQSIVDRILVVDAHRKNQLHRVAARDNCDPNHVNKIIDAQISSDERLSHANDIITNNGDFDDLDQQIHQLHQKYVALAR